MNSKERLFAAFDFKPVDRAPAYVLDGNAWVINEEGMNYTQQFALPDVGAEMIVRRYEELGSDVVYPGSSCWLAWANTFGSEVNTEKVGRTIEVGPAISNLETDIPEMTDEELKEALSNNFYVKTMMKQIRGVKDLIGEEKAVVSAICGPFTAAGTLLGTGEFMLQIGKRNKQVPKLLEFTTRVITTLTKLYYESGADLFLICEPTSSGDMISPRTFKQMVSPYFKQFMANLEGQIPVMLHICGKAGKRIDEVKEFGVKAFSVDSMVDMEEMLEKAEKKMCMMGSLSPSAQMLQGTPESVIEEATRLLDLAKKNGGGLLLSSGCDFPAGSPATNARAMVTAAETFEY